MVTEHLEVGGLERMVVALSGQLVERGYDVAIAAEDRGDLWKELPSSVRRYCSPPRPDGPIALLRYVAWLRRILVRDQWSIVHVHQRRLALLARCAVLGSRRPVVEHVHNVFPAVHRV